MTKEEERLKAEIAELLKQQLEIDAAEDAALGSRRGDEMPDELRFREESSAPLSDRDRKELTGSASYALSPQVSVYGAVARTIATLAENGAGTSLVGGVSCFFAAPRLRSEKAAPSFGRQARK